MATVFLVMATASGFRSDERKPLPLRAFDHAAVIEQCDVLYDRLRELHPTMISEQECFMYREQVRAMAEVRNETLGV